MDDYPVFGILFTMLWLYLVVAWLWFLITLMTDAFRSRHLSEVGKALWTIAPLFVPFVAAIVYLIDNELQTRKVRLLVA